MSAKTVQWDTPNDESVKEHYDDLYFLKQAPSTGSIVTARYKGADVRLKVTERQDSSTSIAEVIGIDGPHLDGGSVDLSVGETVILPDDKRAFVKHMDEDE